MHTRPIIPFQAVGVPWSRTSLIDRFEAKYIPEPNSGCWIWTSGTNDQGYGRFLVGGRLVQAHRFSYQTFKAELIEGLVIDHLCRNTLCVNPDHLEQVTQDENMARARKAQCRRGHNFTLENTLIISTTGIRQCRACNIIRYRRKLERQTREAA